MSALPLTPEYEVAIKQPNDDELSVVRFIDERAIFVNDLLIEDIGRHAAKKAVLVETLSVPDSEVDIAIIKKHGIANVTGITKAAKELNGRFAPVIGYGPLYVARVSGGRGRPAIAGVTFYTSANDETESHKTVQDRHEVSPMDELLSEEKLRKIVSLDSFSAHDVERWANNIRFNGHQDMRILLRYLNEFDDAVLHKLIVDGSTASGLSLREIADAVVIDTKGTKANIEQVRQSLLKITRITQVVSSLADRVGMHYVAAERTIDQARFVWRPRVTIADRSKES